MIARGMQRRVAGLVLACGSLPAQGADLSPIDPGTDYHSYANTDQFVLRNVQIDVRVDLETKDISGAVGLNFKRLDPGATQLVLDTRNLMIIGVSQKATDVLGATAKDQTVWVSRPFHLEKPDPILGSALVIDLPPNRKTTELIRIEYETQPNAPDLQWLSPEQTAGGHKGFLYTRSEAIGARSWLPLQDTGQVRVTYKARIFTDSDVLAVMNAETDLKAKRNGDYSFVMPQQIPASSIALAVGDLQFKDTGARTGVYAEKPMLKAAANELAGMESMLAAGEKSFGPYRFARYDVVVMPPGFPDLRIDYPRLSFLSPTAIVGDKSMPPAVAGGLGGAWSGQVTGNATWRDRWLCDGFTAYFQTKLLELLYGQQRASMEAVADLQSLRRDLTVLPPKDQVLTADLRGRDPKLALGAVSREKGRLFVNFLEAKFGGERFDAFVRGYFDHFAFKNIGTPEFNNYLDENLLQRFPGIVTREQVLAWEDESGVPADAVFPASSGFEPIDAARSAWLSGKLPSKKFGLDWTSLEWRYFLDNMPATLSANQLGDLDKAYGLTRSQNAEIESSWLVSAVRSQYQPAFTRLEEYLKTVGRAQLIVPLYSELNKTPSGAAWAKRVFPKARPTYHPETAAAVDAILSPPPAEELE
jgi:leukotriene-A4 hydrolase